MSAAVYPPIRFEDHRPRRVDDERQPDYDGEPVRPERQEQRGTFRMDPDCVGDLNNPHATHLYNRMLRLAKGSDRITISRKELSAFSGISEGKIAELLDLFTEKGFIRIEKRFNGGMKLPNCIVLMAHRIDAENSETSDRHHMTDDRQEMSLGQSPRDDRPTPRDDHVKKHVNEKHGETTPPSPPRRKSETEQRDHDVVAWWCKVSGARQPADKGAALTAAHALLAAGFTLDTLPGLYEHVKANASVGATLPMLVKWADGYQAKHTPAKPVDDENPKLKGGMGLYWARERKRLVIARKGCQLPSELPRYDDRIAESEANLLAVGVTVQEAEAWAQRH